LTITGIPIATIIQTGNNLEVITANSYLWNTGETSQIITPLTNGNYWCIITDNYGCESDTSFFNVSFIPTTINEQNSHGRKLKKITDILGRESKPTKNTILFYIYDNGTVEKRILIK
jgi:hypothetical protein